MIALLRPQPNARSVGQPELAALGSLMGNLQPLTLPDTLDPLVVDCPKPEVLSAICGISFLPSAYRGARVISTDTLRISLVLEVYRRYIARIEAPMREARSSPPAHRGARVIGADALRILPISQELSDGQERH
jgi:hypothetical protein